MSQTNQILGVFEKQFIDAGYTADISNGRLGSLLRGWSGKCTICVYIHCNKDVINISSCYYGKSSSLYDVSVPIERYVNQLGRAIKVSNKYLNHVAKQKKIRAGG